MSLKVYHVRGTRHCAVLFAASPDEAVSLAVERNLVDGWEAPEAIEVPLPNRRLRGVSGTGGSRTAPTHAATWPWGRWALAWKAGQGVFGTHASVPGRPYLASENSEDALFWNLFRTLERSGRLDVVARALGLEDEFRVLYWYRPWDSAEPLPEIKPALDRVKPWGKVGKRYQTETDVILKGQRYLVMVESKLGKPDTHVRAWERGSKGAIPATYEDPLHGLLTDMRSWEVTMRRFYQLLRHLVLANELCAAGGWGLEPHLLAVVNGLNANRGGVGHAVEFDAFQRALRLGPERTHLLTWQGLLTRAEATFDPGVRPLLAHARRLRYLRPVEDRPG